jgi:hypothetical protein
MLLYGLKIILKYFYKYKMHLDFLLICRNNEEYFKIIFPKLIEKLSIFEPNFYIYENNSTDNTKLELEKLEKQYKNIFVKSENTNNYFNRFKNICIARNNLLNFYKDKTGINNSSNDNSGSNKNWVILFDTNIIFDEKTVIELINKIKYNGVMYCANTLFYDFIKHKVEYYYDILALNYGIFFQKPISRIFDIKKYLNYNEETKLIEVKTGFGGLVLIKKDVLFEVGGWHLIKPKNVKNTNLKSDMICEHWYFCDAINKKGKIYIVNSAKSIWYLDNYLLNNKNRIKFYNYLNNIGFFNLKIKKK